MPPASSAPAGAGERSWAAAAGSAGPAAAAAGGDQHDQAQHRERQTRLPLHAEEQVLRGHVVGSAVAADPTGATAVPGVWVAGNVADMSAQVVVSAAAGLRAGAMINADLVTEDARAAVAARQGVAA